jgi:hypothetical protein
MKTRDVNSGIDTQMYGMHTMKYFVSTVLLVEDLVFWKK